jgi:hypothetical protein
VVPSLLPEVLPFTDSEGSEEASGEGVRKLDHAFIKG